MDVHHVRAVGLDRGEIRVLVEIALGEMLRRYPRLYSNYVD